MTRLRRDPRAERLRHRVDGGLRPRLDRLAPGSAPRERETRPETLAGPVAPRAVTVDAPAFLVAVVPDAPGGRLAALDRQLLGAARLLAEPGGAVVVIAPPLAGAMGPLGADRVTVLPGDAAGDPGRHAAAVAGALAALDPRHTLFPETGAGGDLARRVAALCGAPLFPDAEAISATLVARAARGGTVERRARPGRLLTLVADIVAPYAGPSREGLPLDTASVEAGDASLAIVDRPRDPAAVSLAEADFVAAAGNGVTDIAGFLTLARALGATPGASRVVCDAGLMPRDRQVGASGAVLSGTCYLALGIAGAPQHLQGVAGVEHVIAVNTDLHAAMVRRASLAIIADAQRVMPALLRAVGPSELPPREAPRPSAAAGPRLRVVVLLSPGRHPVSGRACPVPVEIQAIGLAEALGAVSGLHAGPDPGVVADHLGHGLAEIRILPLPDGGDPRETLAEALASAPPDLVLAGRRGRGGDDTGLVPYRLAARLGWPIVADAVSLTPEGGGLAVEQAWGRGGRRVVSVRLPAVVTVHPAAPPGRPFAFAAARRGRLLSEPGELVAPAPLALEERPYRRRPRVIRGAPTAGTAAERLSRATEITGAGGRVMLDPAPDEAAAEILAFLRRVGAVAE